MEVKALIEQVESPYEASKSAPYLAAGIGALIGGITAGPVGAAIGAGSEFLGTYFGEQAAKIIAKRVQELTNSGELATWAGDISSIIIPLITTGGVSNVLSKIATPVAKKAAPKVFVGLEMFTTSPERLLQKTMGEAGDEIIRLTKIYQAERYRLLGQSESFMRQIRSEFKIRGLGDEDLKAIYQAVEDLARGATPSATKDQLAIAKLIKEHMDEWGERLKTLGLPFRKKYGLPHQYKLALFNPDLPIEKELEPLRDTVISLMKRGLGKTEAVNIARVLIGDLRPETSLDEILNKIMTIDNPNKILRMFRIKEGNKFIETNDSAFVKILVRLAGSQKTLKKRLLKHMDMIMSSSNEDKILQVLMAAANETDPAKVANRVTSILFAKRGQSPFLKTRTYAVPFELREQDPFTLLSEYSRTMSDTIAKEAVFGRNYSNLKRLYMKGREYALQTFGDTKPADEVYQKFFAELTKLYPGETSSAITFLRDAQSFVGAMKLAFSWLPNLSQNIVTIAEFGLKNFIKALIKLPTAEARRFLRNVGLHGLDILREYSEMAGMQPGRVERFLRRHPIIDKFARGLFITSERFNSGLGALTAREWLYDVAKKYGDNLDKIPFIIRKKLQNLGISPASLKFIKHGGSDITLDTLVAHSGRRLTQFGASILDKPLGWHSPAVQLLTQFKLFGFNMARYLKRGLEEAIEGIRHGDPTGMYKLLTLGATMPITGSIIRLFFQKVYASDKKLSDSQLARLLEYTAYAGGLGIIGDIALGFAYNPNNPRDIAERIAMPVAITTGAEIIGYPLAAINKIAEEGVSPENIAMAFQAHPIGRAIYRHLKQR